MSYNLELAVQEAAERLADARVIAVLTGAGISVASGIRPFRGKGGLWEKYDPEEVVNISNFRRNPGRTWTMLREMVDVVANAEPNPAHLAIARLGEMGRIGSIITQNVDGLHQKAGSQAVIEFHGNSSRVVCLDCHARYPMSAVNLDIVPPACFDCGGLLKPDAVFFGEPIPATALHNARTESQRCDAMLVVGTSGMVEPAASLPLLAKGSGALIIEVNPEPSWLTQSTVDIFLQGKSEEILPVLVAKIGEKSANKRSGQ